MKKAASGSWEGRGVGLDHVLGMNLYYDHMEELGMGLLVQNLLAPDPVEVPHADSHQEQCEALKEDVARVSSVARGPCS